jgi:hypothetical protein
MSLNPLHKIMFPKTAMSATAAKGKVSIIHDVIFSSIVVAYGGSSQQKLFTVPQGQSILAMKGSTMTITEAHQTTHTEMTTSQEKAGELGTGIGDVSVRGISVVFEAAPPLYDSTNKGSFATYGATPQEVAEALSKMYMQFKIGGVIASQGPLWVFPQFNGFSGGMSISSTKNDAVKVTGFGSNGPMAGWPRKRIPLQIARNDTIAAVVNTANGASLVHSVSSTPGQPYLLYCCLDSLIRGDVRGRG